MVNGQEVDVFNSGVSFERASPAGYEVVEYPTSEEQNVPAYTLFGVFFIMQTMATGLLKERQDGTFRRLLAAPLSRTAMLIGKVIPYYLINVVQVGLMFAIGVLVFGMSLGNQPLGLVFVTLATAGAATGLGLMLASTVNGEEVDRYNVVWDSPSKDATGVMPVGNGDIAAGVELNPGLFEQPGLPGSDKAHREQDEVGLQREFAADNFAHLAPPIFIGHPFYPCAFEPGDSGAIADHPLGQHRPVAFNALFVAR